MPVRLPDEVRYVVNEASTSTQKLTLPQNSKTKPDFLWQMRNQGGLKHQRKLILDFQAKFLKHKVKNGRK